MLIKTDERWILNVIVAIANKKMFETRGISNLFILELNQFCDDEKSMT